MLAWLPDLFEEVDEDICVIVFCTLHIVCC